MEDIMRSGTRWLALLAVFGLVLASCDRPPTESIGQLDSKQSAVAPNVTPEAGGAAAAQAPDAVLSWFPVPLLLKLN